MRLAKTLASLLFCLAPLAAQSERSAAATGDAAPQHATSPIVPAASGDREGDTEGGAKPQGPESDASSPVPEPSTFLLVGTGLVGVALTSRRRRRQHAVA